MSLRAGVAPAEAVLRLRALDAAGRPVFVRRPPRRPWLSEHVEALAEWRWDEERAAPWSDVRALEFLAEGATRLVLDDVTLLAGGPGAALPDRAWVEALAFPAGGGWSRAAGPFVLLGPPSVPPDAAAERTAARLTPLDAWLDRVASEAVRPLRDGPVPVVVLPDRRAYVAFFERLSERWRMNIPTPRGAGHAIQDLCAVAHDPALGLDRPVIVHEALHALVARRLRLVPNNPRHAWLQEALANYLQFALHPESYDRAGWRAWFERGPRPGTSFRPLRELVEERPPMTCYAQLASVAAFLLAERPAWLGPLARDLADGLTAGAALQRLGTTLEALEAEWLAWGRATLGGAELPADGRHFPVPAEWER